MGIRDLFAILATMITSLGGWEAVKYILNRRFNIRQEEAKTDVAEFHVLAETNTWLQQQLQDKERRFAEQTRIVRKLNTEILELTKEKATLELDLQKYRCVRAHCENRQPQNGF